MNINGFLIVVFISTVSFSQNETVATDSLKLTKKFILGKFDYKNHDLFTVVNSDYTSKTIYLNKEVYTAFVNMFNHAKTDSISLKIISGTRNFPEQKFIWERKWEKYNNFELIERAKKILEYSSMPSTSRHHWGTDIDLNSLTNSYFENGKGKREYEWLVKNANKYGFYQVYTDKTAIRTGYNLERWHWSYMSLASKFLVFYNKYISDSDIVGFEGSELAKELRIIPDYVNGVSEESKLVPYFNK